VAVVGEIVVGEKLYVPEPVPEGKELRIVVPAVFKPSIEPRKSSAVLTDDKSEIVAGDCKNDKLS
jgi:hypothetical protein